MIIDQNLNNAKKNQNANIFYIKNVQNKGFGKEYKIAGKENEKCILLMDKDNINLTSFFDSLLIIIVIYKTKIDDSDSFNSILKNLEFANNKTTIYFYDNSPDSQVIKKYNYAEILYYHDKENSGVSKAYNEGYKLAKSLNKRWLLLLDQDTEFNNQALYKYYKAIIDYPNINLFCPLLKNNNIILSPCKYYFKSGFLFKDEFYGILKIKNKTILNSGICISVDSFEKIGGYDEKTKLYFSDFNFIDRYRKKYKNFVVIDNVANHNLSFLGNNLQQNVSFFKNYCIGAKTMIKNIPDFFIILIIVLFRLLLLFIKFKSFVFFRIFIKNFILNKR